MTLHIVKGENYADFNKSIKPTGQHSVQTPKMMEMTVMMVAMTQMYPGMSPDDHHV